MAESALFSIASSLLSKIASSTFKISYERAQSIWGVREDLHQLQHTIATIQAVLLDAENKQQDSATIKNWIARVRSVLYEADDLFDEVATNDLLRKQIKGNKLLKEVRVSFSKLNPVVSLDSFAKKVKAIRKSLDQISKDMALFNLEIRRDDDDDESIGGLRKGLETRPFVDPKVVIGRDDEKEDILKFLFDDGEQSVSLIAIVGIGGMGKTTLAQLVYNDEQVQKRFEKRWWACISDISDEIEVLRRISQSMSGEIHHGCDFKQLISDRVSCSGSYLLVLDDVWDNNLGMWIDIISLLSKGVKGCKIIVTTRFLSVPRAIQKDKCRIYTLGGLSEDKSWELFKMIAFTEEQEKDPNWSVLGREIVKKCANVPLAVKCVASLLCTKTTMIEWESLIGDKLLSIGSIKSTLKLSYDHLPSNLKHCFAYCSLFPKDHTFYKEGLVNLWIAQGYVRPSNEEQTVEEVGHAYFIELLSRSFFQEAKEKYGEIESCKMHDLVHDLAQEVAGEESIMLTGQPNQFCKKIRHLSVGFHEMEDSRRVSSTLLDTNRIRSFILMYGISPTELILDQLITKLKLLRTLDLKNQSIEKVSSSIGELKHLRYLNLSGNFFRQLPDSITKLVNLLILDISHCQELEVLPNDFRKLANLRHLDTKECRSLRHMPPGFEELTSLQCLSYFKASDKNCGLHVLAGLKLRGELKIKFDKFIDDWSGDQCWQLPSAMRVLRIENYPGMRIPNWAKAEKDLPLVPNLVRLQISHSQTIKHLPSLRHLPYLKTLELLSLRQLEYIEEEELAMLFFPSLEDLALVGLPKLKRWSSEVASVNKCLPLLSVLRVIKCPELKSFPLSPSLQSLQLVAVTEEIFQQLMSSPLKSIEIHTNDWLRSFHGETLTSLQSLEFRFCNSLRDLYLAESQHNLVHKVKIDGCEELELWDEEKRGVEWESLPNLNLLMLNKMPKPERLLDCLQRRQALGELEICSTNLTKLQFYTSAD